MYKKFLVFAFLVFTGLGAAEVFGHGVGYEVMPSVMLGDKQVALEITSSRYEDPESQEREVRFSLLETSSGITVRDVTYHIIAYKGETFLFEDRFQTNDGIFVMSFVPSKSETIIIDKGQQGGFFDGFIGTQQDVVVIKGTPFNSGGLYKFDVKILTAESYSNELEPPIQYDVGLSIQDQTYYDIEDRYFGKQKIEIITYYDLIENFQFNSQTKAILFEMPFEWEGKNINQTSVVHEEVIIPKTFGDMMVSSYSVSVNGYELPQSVIQIDDFFEEKRIVHIIINQNELLALNQKQSSPENKISFVLKPSAPNLPLSALTENGQFKVALNWEPRNFESGSELNLIFDVLDVFLKDRPIKVPYEVVAIYDDNEIFHDSGISSDSKNEHNTSSFVVPEDATGLLTIRFENLDRNSKANVSFPLVINREEIVISEQIIIPDWVRNNAGWWSEGQISDKDFASGIEFMIKNQFIIVPISESDQESTENATIPDWVRNNAGWWSEGQISDKDFASGLQFLISKGIISV